jgi:hypothetical protein
MGVREQPAIELKWKGQAYKLELGEITGREDRDFRLAVGMTVVKAFDLVSKQELLLEPIAGLLWLFARRDNPDLSYDDVLDSVTYADLAGDEEEEDEAPLEAAETVPLTTTS